MQSLNEHLEELARLQPEKIALFQFDQDPITFYQLNQVTKQLAKNLTALNHDPMTPVAIAANHGLDHALLILSLLRAEITGLSLDLRDLTSFNTSWLKNVGIQSIVTTKALTPWLHNQMMGLKEVELKSYPKFNYLSITSNTPTTSNAVEKGWILQTSGTTGVPKAVMISYQDLLSRSLSEPQYLKITSEDKSLNCLTFNHDVGLVQLITNVLLGSTLIIEPLIFYDKLLKLIEEQGIHSIWGTPYVWKNLLQQISETKLQFTSVKMCTISAGPLSITDQQKLREVFPAARFVRTYGQTETFRTYYSDQLGHFFDKTVPGVEALLVQDKDNKGSDEFELVHQGAGTMAGYIENCQISSAGKSIATGDYFRIMENDKVEFIGRKDGILKRLDQRFHPSEVEKMIVETFHEAKDSFVFLAQDENLVAFVEVQSDNIQNLQDKINKELFYLLPRYKQPSQVICLATFPRTSVGKTDAKALKLKYHSLFNNF